jgi:hypothetical protein
MRIITVNIDFIYLLLFIYFIFFLIDLRKKGYIEILTTPYPKGRKSG